MSERYIELTDRKWKHPSEDKAIRWALSQKGNFYTTFRGFVIVVMENRYKKGVWQYMTTPDTGRNKSSEEATPPAQSQWEVSGKFDTADETKAAALSALRPKRESVPVPTSDETPATGGRKIVL